MLVTLIKAYQKVPIINRMVRWGVGAHHAIVKPELRPCPYAGECSNAGLAQAQVMGMAALPLILSRMGSCGPGVDRAEWCIRGGVGVEGCWHEHPSR